MGEEEASFYLAEIAAGLKDLHTLGFVHRDVKPENVIITRTGHTKLVDFGSAARLDASGNVVSNERIFFWRCRSGGDEREKELMMGGGGRAVR